MKTQDDYLDAGLRGYILRMAHRNAYRIAGCDVDDLIQEGYVVYYHCRARYVGAAPTNRADGSKRRYLPPTKPDGAARRHFMGLFKTALRNRLATMATKQSAYSELNITDLAGEDQTIEQAWDSIVPGEDEVASVAVLLATAPSEIKQLFALLINDALTLSGYRRYGRKRLAPRETNNRYWCRLLGLPEGTDLEQRVTQHFLSK